MLNTKQRSDLLKVLRARFEENMHRHSGVNWTGIQDRLDASPGRLLALNEMERTGGEPDIVSWDSETVVCSFVDCSWESPRDRRSLCYDRAALDARKEHKPRTSALDLAVTMGIELLTEHQYRRLQEFGEFDTKTSSWVATPPEIRRLGGALFGDRRYGRVFVYHNGAQSYYASRGFRGSLRV
jgi:hypothetical protein